jgi:hypothetical protein
MCLLHPKCNAAIEVMCLGQTRLVHSTGTSTLLSLWFAPDSTVVDYEVLYGTYDRYRNTGPYMHYVGSTTSTM